MEENMNEFSEEQIGLGGNGLCNHSSLIKKNGVKIEKYDLHGFGSMENSGIDL